MVQTFHDGSRQDYLDIVEIPLLRQCVIGSRLGLVGTVRFGPAEFLTGLGDCLVSTCRVAELHSDCSELFGPRYVAEFTYIGELGLL